MYKSSKISVVIPAYNEEKLIEKTVETIPDFVDYIIVVNDTSTDSTLEKLHDISQKNKKLKVISNAKNLGVGGSLKVGYRYALDETDADTVGVVSGDAQCDPKSLKPMLAVLEEEKVDYVKGNRFFYLEELKTMPKYRRLGNIFASILTKFSTGYYSISDTQMGFGFFRRSILEKINFDLIRERYDYENSMLIALSIASAKVKDHPVPAIYGEETSSIDFLPTVARTLRTVWVGFWQRIFYKYILYSFHPIALFLIGGLVLTTFGFIFGLFVTYERIAHQLSPSTGTVMLVVLPLFLGFQLLLTAVTMDMNNEGR